MNWPTWLGGSGNKALATTNGKEPPPRDDGSLIEPVRNLFRLYPSDGISPAKYKNILRQADQGWTQDLMELFDDVAVDAHVSTVLGIRKLAVAGAPQTWKTPEGDESAAAQTILEETRDWFQEIPELTEFLMDLLDAFYRGFSCVRPIWEVVDHPKLKNRQMICGTESIESRFFRFENGITPLILAGETQEATPVPVEYLYRKVRRMPGPVVRGGIGRTIGKLWIYKGYNLIDLASYLERFGHPHVQVELPPHIVEGSPELERAKSAAKSLIADQVGLVPQGVTLKILEAINKAATVNDTYLAFMRWCDEGISEVAQVGPLTASSSQVGGLGHGAEAKAHTGVKQETKEFDGRGLSRFLNQFLIKPRTIRQYGLGAPIPVMSFDVEEPEDEVETATAQKMRAETIAILQKCGLSISKSSTYEEFDLQEPDEAGDDVLEASTPPPAPDVQSEKSVTPE